MKPLISVIMPVYNGERYLTGTIKSILSQNYKPIEIIAVDDGSADNSAQIIKQFSSLRYYFQTNSGPNATRNAGIKKARGDFLAFIDQDDIWLPGKLTRQMSAFEGKPDLDIVYGHVEQFYSSDINEIKVHIKQSNMIMPGYIPSAMMVKRKSLLLVGLFDAKLRMGELIDWYARAMEQHLISAMLPDIVVKRRIHETNIGILEPQSRIDYVRALKTTLDRRRSVKQERKIEKRKEDDRE
jgi:glycosyltransferase involved in cell wall biosynthesis